MDKNDYTIKLGLDTTYLEKQYKEFYAKLDKVEAKRSKLGRSGRAASAPNAPYSKFTPNLTSSQRERSTLSSRMSASASRTFAGVDGDFAARIKKAQLRIKELKKELKSTNNFEHVASIRNQFRELNNEIANAVRGQKKLNKAMNRGSAISQKFGSTAKSAMLSLVSAYAAIGAAKEVYRIGKDFDAMQAGLLAASDGAVEAKQNFKFLSETSRRLGTDIEVGVSGFNRLGSAMKGNFNAKEIKDTFTAIQEASVTFQLNKEKSNLVMIAMGQMAAKGKISSEELSRQLGDHLPIMKQAAEEATGKSYKEVLEMMKKGKLMASEFLVPFSNAMRRIVRENGALQKATEKLTSEQTRLSNAYKLMINNAFQSGGATALSKMFKKLTSFVEDNSEELEGFIKLLVDATAAVVDLGLGIAKLAMGFADIIGKIASFGTASNGIKFIISLFYDLLSVIYRAITGLHLIKAALTFDGAALKDYAQNANSVYDAATKSTREKNLQYLESKKPNVKVDKVELTSYNSDPEATTREFENRMSDIFSNSMAY